MIIIQLDSEQLMNLIQKSVRKVLNESSTQTTITSKQDDQHLTVKEAASFLNITVPTLYSKNSRGELPSCKPPGCKRLFFLKSDLIEYLKQGRRKTAFEIKIEAEAYINKPRNDRDGK